MPDFEITVRPLEDDPLAGVVGARGATGELPTDADVAHVRNVIKGQLAMLDGALPIGWELELVVNEPTGSQEVFRGDPRKSVQVVDMGGAGIVDRFTQVTTAVCGNCGGGIANQGDGVWYHLQPCADPSPREEPLPIDPDGDGYPDALHG